MNSLTTAVPQTRGAHRPHGFRSPESAIPTGPRRRRLRRATAHRGVTHRTRRRGDRARHRHAPVTRHPGRRVHRRACGIPRRAHRAGGRLFRRLDRAIERLERALAGGGAIRLASGAATSAKSPASIRRGCPVIRDGGHVHRALYGGHRLAQDPQGGRCGRGSPASRHSPPLVAGDGHRRRRLGHALSDARPHRRAGRSWPAARAGRGPGRATAGRRGGVSALRRVENAPWRSGDAKHATTTARHREGLATLSRRRKGLAAVRCDGRETRGTRWPGASTERPAVGIEPAGVGSPHRGRWRQHHLGPIRRGRARERRRRFQDRLQERLLSCCGTVIRHAGYRPRGGAR